MIERARLGAEGIATFACIALLAVSLFASVNACPVHNWGEGCNFICYCLLGACNQSNGRCDQERCQEGWFGKTCNITATCLHTTCQNGGMCMNSYKDKDGYYCACSYGFHGKNCQEGKKVSIIRNLTDVPTRQNITYRRLTMDDLVPDNHTFLGCHSDPEGREIQEKFLMTNEDMTIRKCVLHCSAQTEKLTVIALRKGKECRCADLYGKAISSNLCNTRCKSESYCGGDEHYSIYSICPLGHWGALCKSECHCLGSRPCIFMSGNCMANSTECVLGWTGKSCNRETHNALVTPRFTVTALMGVTIACTVIGTAANAYHGYFQFRENLIYAQINDNLREGRYYDNTTAHTKIQQLALEKMKLLNLKPKLKLQQQQQQYQQYHHYQHYQHYQPYPQHQ